MNSLSMNSPLDNMTLITDVRSRRSSSRNPNGGNITFLTDIAPGDKAVLLDTKGPGKVTHIWMTIMEYAGHDTFWRDLVIRMYWDGSETPSVEVPLGDFFGVGHTLPAPYYEKKQFAITSATVGVGVNERALNCYWPMPFHKSARIEIYNNGEQSLKLLYFHVDYELGEQPANAGLFHALFRQDKELQGQTVRDIEGKDNYVLLETEGRGQYVGCFMYVDSSSGEWWGDGGDMIFIDHDTRPTLLGTGTEDYFNNAWCFCRPFSAPYYGFPLSEDRADGGKYTTMYRFHVCDPIHFQSHIKVSIEHLWGDGLTHCYSSVAFWYQEKPIASRPALPVGAANHSRRHGETGQKPPMLPEVDVPGLEAPLRAKGLTVATKFLLGEQSLRGCGLVVDTKGGDVEIPLTVPKDGLYRVEFKPVYGMIDGQLTVRAAGGSAVELKRELFQRENDGPFVNLGNVQSKDGIVTLTVGGASVAPIHQITLKRLD